MEKFNFYLADRFLEGVYAYFIKIFKRRYGDMQVFSYAYEHSLPKQKYVVLDTIFGYAGLDYFGEDDPLNFKGKTINSFEWKRAVRGVARDLLRNIKDSLPKDCHLIFYPSEIQQPFSCCILKSEKYLFSMMLIEGFLFGTNRKLTRVQMMFDIIRI